MIRMDSLGRRIDRQSGFILSYNANVIAPEKMIAIPKLHIKLVDLLAYLETRYHLKSEILGNHIIIRNERPKAISIGSPKMKNRKDAMNTSEVLRASSTHPENGQSRNIIITGNHSNSSITLINTVPKATYRNIKIETENSAALVRASSQWQLKIIRAAHQKQEYYPRQDVSIGKPQKDRSTKELTAAIGLTGDETFYVQPTLRVGMPWLFGLLSWRTNFSTSGIVYGIGTQFYFSEHWAIALTAKTGGLLKKFEWMDTDSTIGKIRIKGNMSQISLLATRGIGRLTVQFGPTVSFLKSSYSFSGDNQPTRNQLDSTYHLIKPLYIIDNAYSDEDKKNKKMWIGLQVSLSYQLR